MLRPPKPSNFSSALFTGMLATLPAIRASADDLEVVRVRQNFYMIAGAGGNVAVQIGENGVVLVDSGSAAFSDAVLTRQGLRP